MEKKFYGILALLLTTILWGSSFPIIKLVMLKISGYTYTWMRSFLALLLLLPYVLYLRNVGELKREVVKGGLIAGFAYALGLWLQGWGTKYTTASNSAFITGLNVVFVHAYVAFTLKNYDWKLILSLVLSLTGLYMLTSPSTGFNIGDFLVLLGAVMWAAQIIIIDKYSSSNPFALTFFEMIPALMFIIPSLLIKNISTVSLDTMLLLLYLAFFCSVMAFSLQVYGQRFVNPAVASIIFLFEPVFATFFAHILLSETLSTQQSIGASLILFAMFLATTNYEKEKGIS